MKERRKSGDETNIQRDRTCMGMSPTKHGKHSQWPETSGVKRPPESELPSQVGLLAPIFKMEFEKKETTIGSLECFFWCPMATCRFPKHQDLPLGAPTKHHHLRIHKAADQAKQTGRHRVFVDHTSS